MEIKTHEKIDQRLCGKPVKLGENYAEVELETTEEMAADEKGLVHGGFIFGQADYAAMLAVNHPNVVLGGANVRFLKPVKVGERVLAIAKVISEEGKKRIVDVVVKREDEEVFKGEFICFVLPKHVLDR
ncbi:hotdog domain-containing protein [Desulfurobacterium crinifex]